MVQSNLRHNRTKRCIQLKTPNVRPVICSLVVSHVSTGAPAFAEIATVLPGSMNHVETSASNSAKLRPDRSSSVRTVRSDLTVAESQDSSFQNSSGCRGGFKGSP